MSTIPQAFAKIKEAGKVGLIPFLTVGYPDLDSTVDLCQALVEGGADLIELGIPFSDPLADGTTIQKSSQVALSQGVNLKKCLTTAAKISRKVDVPLLFMGYYNPIFAFGLEEFCARSSAAGISGLIIPDLPPEEAEELLSPCRKHDLDLIFLLAPTSTEERIKIVCRQASGFIYCVSLVGVTGARAHLPRDLADFIQRVRRQTPLPLAVGFGISTRRHIRAVSRVADAAVIGSALIDRIGKLPPGDRHKGVRDFIAGLSVHK